MFLHTCVCGVSVLCVFVCVCVHACVCVCFCIHVCVVCFVHVCVCACMHACVRVCVCVCVQNVAHKDWTDTNVVVEFINSLGAKIQCFVQGILNSKVFKDSTSQLSIQNQHTMQIKSELTKVYIILFF